MARAKFGAVLLAVVVATSFMGSAAFTTATLDRTVNIPVVADTGGGIIGFEDNSAGDVISLNTTSGNNQGEIELNFSNSSSSGGLNTGAQVTFGDESNIKSTPVDGNETIELTNNANTARNVSLNFTGALNSSGGLDGSDVQVLVYSKDGTQNGTVQLGETADTFPLDSGESLFLIIKVDSRGVSGGNGAEGTLTVKVEP